MKLIVPTVALFVVFGTTAVYAQTVRERTIEEIKIEAQARAERGGYGDVPKDAWINPSGGHLGREKNGWTDPVIFQKVIAP